MVLLWGLASRVFMLIEAWRDNPFGRVPAADADVYWRWAGEIAAGQWLSTTPFMSAPLYPYLVGVVRALGGGLLTVYTLQVGLHLATAGLLAYGAARRLDAATGLLAGILFVLLLEPAFFAGRVLNCTLQLFFITLLWLALCRARQRSSGGAWALVGGLTGVNCLLNPPMLLALVLFGAWACGRGGWGRRGLANAAVLLGTAVLVILPATMHNYRVSGELIPISAQAGVTFAQGNAPGAQGIYTPLAGVSVDRRSQNLDVLRLYRRSTGEAGGWNAANRFFIRKGLDYWRANPGDALQLFFRKLWWFLTGQNVGDIYVPALEIEAGLADGLRAAPLPLAWLLLPALVAAGTLARRPRQYAPELVLFALPLLVVVLFWYSPRYRLPALPVIVVACAHALRQAVRWRTHWKWSLAVAPALVAGVAFSLVNRAVGFDRPESYRADFCYALGNTQWTLGRLDQAAAQYRQTLALRPDFALAAGNLGSVLVQMGRHEEGVAFLRRAVAVDSSFAFGYCQLGQALLTQNQVEEALRQFRTAVQLNPDEPLFRQHLARALLQQGDAAAAREQFLNVLRLEPANVEAHLSLATLLLGQGDADGALHHLREALRFDPRSFAANAQIGEILWARGEQRGAIAAMRRAHDLAPDHPGIANNLAWYLATGAGLTSVERETALQLARRATAAANPPPPECLDTLAAALAANGRFAEAVEALEQAVALAEQRGATEMAAEFRPRLELYRAGQPYVTPGRRPEP